MSVNVRDLTPPQARLITEMVYAERVAQDRALYAGKVMILEREMREVLGRLSTLELEVAALSRIALQPRPIPRVPEPVTQIVEWRPNHRRVRDGGRRVNAQRREVGVR